MYKFYHILIYSRALNIYLLLEPIIQNWTVKNGVNGFKTKKILILEKKSQKICILCILLLILHPI